MRPSDQCFSDVKEFRYKPSRTVSSRKRARVNTPYSSAELPTTLNDINQTISKEYNTSGIIAEVINHKTDLQPEGFDSFLKYLSNDVNPDGKRISLFTDRTLEQLKIKPFFDSQC